MLVTYKENKRNQNVFDRYKRSKQHFSFKHKMVLTLSIYSLYLQQFYSACRAQLKKIKRLPIGEAAED